MANTIIMLLLIVNVLYINASDKDRRLVLHSDTDVVTELNKLRTELNDQKTIIQRLTSEIDSLKTVKVKQDTDIQNLTTNLIQKDREIKYISNELTTLKSDQQTAIQNITLQLKSSTNLGSSYVRWGKHSCPVNGTSPVYSGFMAGSLRSLTGGTSNYLCLSGQPTWDYYEDGIQGFDTVGVYGVEYEFGYHSASSRTKFFGSDILNDDAPCSVCHTRRATNIMIPGRNTCYDGWTKEYSGYLVTDRNNLPHGYEYICIDRRPDVVQSGKHKSDENVLFLVEANCGKTLECPPYVHGRELACVVCSM